MVNTIETLAVQFGSDKRKEIHGYTDHYWRYFRDLKPAKLLEIGVFAGASVNMWNSFFPECKITGVDSNPDTLSIKTIDPSIELQIGDQADAEFLKSLGYFDIIIDDGGHTMKQQIVSFKTLWHRLNDGGIYVIEDLHTSYWPEFQDYEMRTVDFLKILVDSVNLNGLNGYGDVFSPASQGDVKGYGWAKLQAEARTVHYTDIEWIHFYKSIVFIKKRA